MEFFLIIFLLVILVLFGLIFWIIKIFKFYRQQRTKIAIINSIVFGLLTLVVCWELRIIPLSADLDFRNQTKGLTGKQFWCRNDYRYDEIGIRGEGFTFEIYKMNDETAKYFINPDKDFFENFPREKFETTKWKETPILDTDLVNFVTPIYGNWSLSLQKEIEEKQMLVRQVAKDKGSYYAVRQSHGTDLYLISPKRKIIIYINHNM
jgi:hypothetical protein